jgi:hypothetical protein
LARLHPLSAITVPQHLYNPTGGLPQMLADFSVSFWEFFLEGVSLLDGNIGAEPVIPGAGRLRIHE